LKASTIMRETETEGVVKHASKKYRALSYS